MVSEELKRRLSRLRRAEARPGRCSAELSRRARWRHADLQERFREGSVCRTARGEVFVRETGLREVYSDAEHVIERYVGAFQKAAELAEEGALPRHLEPLTEADVGAAALIDTETAGLHGRPLFMVGLGRYRDEDLVLTQYFARNYAEEAGLLDRLASLLPELKLLISFNGKAFDWPFIRDRMVYHRLSCGAAFAHLDLLHPSRRRWRARLPNCKLQTLERYLCGRWRAGDIPGDQIPQRYHDFVREQDARLIAPIFHHNRLDLITMTELLAALLGSEERRQYFSPGAAGAMASASRAGSGRGAEEGSI